MSSDSMSGPASLYSSTTPGAARPRLFQCKPPGHKWKRWVSPGHAVSEQSQVAQGRNNEGQDRAGQAADERYEEPEAWHEGRCGCDA